MKPHGVNISPLLCAAALLLPLVGCSAQRRLEGSWAATKTTSYGFGSATSRLTCTFNPDGTVQMETHTDSTVMTMDISTNGTGTVDKDHINIKASSVSFGTGAAQAVPSDSAPMVFAWSLKDKDTLDLTPVSVRTNKNPVAAAMGTPLVELKRQK